LPEHRFEVWRHDQRDPVFVFGRCMRRRTGRYGAKLHRWTQVVPADVQDASLATYMEGIQSFPIGLQEDPGLGALK